MSPTLKLLKSPAFCGQAHCSNDTDRARLAYVRAKDIGLSHQIELDDIKHLTSKFWELHSDPILTIDGASATLLTIQYNLVIGTLSQYLPLRQDLRPLIDDLLSFRKIGQLFLTELGHGIDVEHMESTATLLDNGEIVLNTPNQQAAKFMPPTVPVNGVPCIGIVFAMLIVGGEYRGIRPFIVNINDGFEMCPGISAQLLPHREGTTPVNHSLTYFRSVRLPKTALLGPLESSSTRREFSETMWRVAVGSIALGITAAAAMQVSCAIAALYSIRRTVMGPSGRKMPIIHFRTQQIPVLTGLAQAYVLRAFTRWAVTAFSDTSSDRRVRHGVAACAKAAMVQLSYASIHDVSERCGAQGLFGFNQMSRLLDELRGIAIAEGDILALSIRLATELLLGRYELPPPTNPNSLLARHEQSLFAEQAEVLASVSHHRSEAVNRLILPHCQAMVEAIGHRMAYDAAVAYGVLPCLVDLYVASIVKLDSAWYVEKAGMSRQAQEDMLASSIDTVLPQLSSLIEGLNVVPYITAPIISDGAWSRFVTGLEYSEVGSSTPDLSKDPMPRAHL